VPLSFGDPPLRKPSSTLLSIIVCTTALLSSATLPAQKIKRLDGHKITTHDAETFTDRILAQHHITGAQIAVLNHGKPVWSYAYGLAQKSPDRFMDLNTTTWGASITKAVFATYAMQLVADHKLDLDIPMAAQLPQPLDTYPRYKTIGAELVKDPQWQRVTPRMLLAHTSGLGNVYFLEPDQKLHLHFAPGSRFAYSTEGINLVGFLVEQKLGQPLDALMQQAIFQPLHMTRTALVFHPDFLPNVADRFDANGKLIGKTRRDSERAGGSMTTSADDLARFLEALLADKLLPDAARQQMLSPQIAIPYAHQFPTFDTTPASPPNIGLAYGLGWGLLTKTKYGPAFFKEGHGDGAQNVAICFQRSGNCMIILTNSDNGELAFRPLLEHILGDTVTPWEWQCYTESCILHARENQ